MGYQAQHLTTVHISNKKLWEELTPHPFKYSSVYSKANRNYNLSVLLFSHPLPIICKKFTGILVHSNYIEFSSYDLKVSHQQHVS
jgi:hypothetical protein